MDLFWGITDNAHFKGGYDPEPEPKRRRTGYANSGKRLFELNDDNKMIYSVGSQVHFTAEINNETIEALIKEVTKVVNDNLPKFGAKDEKITLTYIVDSPGGSVTAVLKFVDFISMVKLKHPHIEFVSIITGIAASAGTIMCAVADKRAMTRNAFAMIHELSSGNMGKYTQLISYSEYIKTMHNKLASIYVTHCGIDREKLEELLMRETWFDAEAYKELGFVDEIKG